MVSQMRLSLLLAAFGASVIAVLAVLVAWPTPPWEVASVAASRPQAPSVATVPAPPLSLDEPSEADGLRPKSAVAAVDQGDGMEVEASDSDLGQPTPGRRGRTVQASENEYLSIESAGRHSRAVRSSDADTGSDESVTLHDRAIEEQPDVVPAAIEGVDVAEQPVIEEIVTEDFTVTPEPTQPTDSTPNYVTRGEAALTRVRFDLASIGYSISFHPANGTHRGLTFTRRRHIEVYVRPSMSNAELLYVIGHEMGHAIDHVLNSAADRDHWRSVRGMPADLPWWPDSIGSDLRTPAGDFAECFASSVAGSWSHSAWGSCAGTEALLAQLSAPS